MDFPIVFYGHEVFPGGLVPDIILAFSANLYLSLYIKAQQRGNKKGIILWGYLFFMYLPNAIYLFAEIRHILLKDGVADNKEPIAVLVFGGLSLLGLLITLSLINKALTHMNFMSKNPMLFVIIICFASTWGTVLGIFDLNTLIGAVIPPMIIYTSIKAFTVKWVVITLVLGTFLSLLSITTLKLKQKGERNEKRTLLLSESN